MFDLLKRGRKQGSEIVDVLDRVSFISVFFYWLATIIFFGIGYFLLNVYTSNSLVYMGDVISNDISGIFNSFYFSAVTATSVGYGDIIPIGLNKLFAAIETILGLIIYGILISKLVGAKQKVILEEVYDISFEEVIDRLRSALYLFRSDVNRFLEKVDSNSIKQREVRDLWMLFSNLDMTLTDVKKIVMPSGINKYHKTLDSFRLELIINSVQLSLDKILELVRTLSVQEFKWKTELLLKSIDEVLNISNDITDHLIKKRSIKKVQDKLSELKNTINEIEQDVKDEMKKEEEEKTKK